MALNISLSSAWSRVTERIIDNSSSQQKECVSSSEEVSYGGVQSLTHFTYPISGARREWALKIWCQGQRACFVPLSFSVCPGVWGCPLPRAAAVGASQDTRQSCTEVTRFLSCHKSSFAEWSDPSSGNIRVLTTSPASYCPPLLGGRGTKSELQWKVFKFQNQPKLFFNTGSLYYSLRCLSLGFAEWFIYFENLRPEFWSGKHASDALPLQRMQAEGGNGRQKGLEVKTN